MRPKKTKKKWEGRIYIGRDEDGKQLFHYVGQFDTRRERDNAVAEARVKLASRLPGEMPLCDDYVKSYLAEYADLHKQSSLEIVSERLARFRRDFAGRSLDIPRAELKDWMKGEGSWSHMPAIPVGYRQAVVSLYNYAIDEDDIPLPRNPARKLGRLTRSTRSQTPPPTEEEFDRLLLACSALGAYAPRMRELMLFAAYELMRPSELFAIRETDVDFEGMRIMKRRRVFRGKEDTPKTGPVEIPLTPPARDAIANRPDREGGLLFLSKQGKRMSSSTLSGYWAQVTARAELSFDFYHATKHYGVHYMWNELQMTPRAIAALAGWKTSTVIEMLETYGHADVGALEEVDATFARIGDRVRHRDAITRI